MWFITDESNTTNRPASIDEAYKIKQIPSVVEFGGKHWSAEHIDPKGEWMILRPSDEPGPEDPYKADREEPHSGEHVAFDRVNPTEKIDEAQQNSEKTLLYFTANWCGPCKIMDKLVFSADKSVAASKSFKPLKVDIDRHPDLKKAYNIGGIPVLVVLDEQGNEIARKGGYTSVNEFLDLLSP